MEENMNNEVEVTTEVSGAEEVTQEITIEDSSSGPSKGFIALVAGGVAAVVVGTVIAIKRHKKKKAARKDEDENEIEEGQNPDDIETKTYADSEEESAEVE